MARATILYTVATFIPRVALFLLLPVYARALTPADVGTFSLLVSLAGLLAILYRLGLDAALLRFHFDHERDPGRLYATVLAVAVGDIVALTIVAALVLALGWDAILPGIAFIPAGLLALAIGAGNSLQFVAAAWYRAREQPGGYLLLTAGIFAATAGLTLWLVVGVGAGLVGALAGQLAGAFAFAAVALVIVLRMPRLGLDRGIAEHALRFGLPLVPHAMAAWLLNVADRWLLAWLLPLPAAAAQAQVGVYWIGYQLGYAVALVAVSLQSAWLPIVYRQTDAQEGGRIVGAMLLVAIAFLAAVAVSLGAVGPELIAIVAGPAYDEAAPVVAIVAAASIFYGMYAMVVPVLLHERRTATVAAVTLGAGLLNVTINVAVIPVLGIIGSALATLAANAAYAAGTIWLVSHRWPLRVSWRRLAPLTATAVALLLSAAWLGTSVPLGTRVAVAIVFAITGFWATRPTLPMLSRGMAGQDS